MKKKLVMAGCGHAHLQLLSRLHTVTGQGHHATIISPSAFHYYSGMGPGMLGGSYNPDEIRFSIKDMACSRGADFLQDRVIRIDPHLRKLHLLSGKHVSYDILSCNLGSAVPLEDLTCTANDVFPVKPIEQLVEARGRLKKLLRMCSPKILVIGGGPAAVEVAGNAWRLAASLSAVRPDIEVIAGRNLLINLPPKARHYTLTSFADRGIAVLDRVHVSRIEGKKAVLDNGFTIHWDICFAATGITPPDIFLQSGLPVGPDGGMLVNRYLQCTTHPEIFGGGDCISFHDRPLQKIGVYAVRQGPRLLHNIVSALNEKPLIPFRPQNSCLLILNLGDGKGLFCRGNHAVKGRWCYLLKHIIDKRFVRTFRYA